MSTYSLTADDYCGVQNFFARQMQLLDAAKPAEWADTFTEDGEFHVPGFSEPTVGRAALTAAATNAIADFTARGLQRRHILTMVHVTSDDGGNTIKATSYATILTTPLAGETSVQRSTVCYDTLVRDGNSFLTKHRLVTRDDFESGRAS